MSMAKCKVGEILDAASPEERTALTKALMQTDKGSYTWSAKKLSRAIEQTQYSVGATTIKEHRNKICRCVK